MEKKTELMKLRSAGFTAESTFLTQSSPKDTLNRVYQFASPPLSAEDQFIITHMHFIYILTKHCRITCDGLPILLRLQPFSIYSFLPVCSQNREFRRLSNLPCGRDHGSMNRPLLFCMIWVGEFRSWAGRTDWESLNFCCSAFPSLSRCAFARQILVVRPPELVSAPDLIFGTNFPLLALGIGDAWALIIIMIIIIGVLEDKVLADSSMNSAHHRASFLAASSQHSGDL